MNAEDLPGVAIAGGGCEREPHRARSGRDSAFEFALPFADRLTDRSVALIVY
jgi:hypothetical protein